MGYAMAYDCCCCCGETFGFNPHKVPSIRLGGVREPVCRDCIEDANLKRSLRGEQPLVVHPDAYEPISEEEL